MRYRARWVSVLLAAGSLSLVAVGCTETDGAAPDAVAGSAASGGREPVGGAGESGAGESGAGGSNDGGTSGAAGAGAGGEAAGAGGDGATDGRTMDGYTLFAILDETGSFEETRLIDMAGNLVHTWALGGTPSKLLPGGNLIGASGTYPGDTDQTDLLQVDWNGETVWSFNRWEQSAEGVFRARQHHDFQREGNPVGYYAPGQDFVTGGNTIVLAHTDRNVPALRDTLLVDDAIYEVDGSGALLDTVWIGSEHVAEYGFDSAALADIHDRDPGQPLELLHGNSISLVGPNHWFDEGHAEFDPRNIVYSSRHASFVLIIDRDTGDTVWRIGPDFAGRPEEPIGQIIGQHHPHIIPQGLPGAGNMLIFDNGGPAGYGGPDNSYRYSRSWSRVIEINPLTMDIVWQYGAASGAENFSSRIVSNAQRLPNGNTLITIGTSGKLIEVTADKQIVWQYEYTPRVATLSNLIYRSYRIPPEWLPAGENEAHGRYAKWADQNE